MAIKKKEVKETKHKFHLGRPPIVAVLGHVDHGKTTLLDAIRGTNVQGGEVGGITQSVRAHKVTWHDMPITFIDTPGHEAFSDMRSRGANVTDIVMLVVAVDDGIQPQTKESIKFAKKAKVPVVVAANKVDLPGINLDKLKKELSTNDLLIEEYGGDVVFIPVSATKKTGLDDLMEHLFLVAEVHELKNERTPIGIAEGVVLESTRDKRLGPVALVLIKNGQIGIGSYIQSEHGYSKIRAILDENQKQESIASTSDPVWIVGLEDVINTGEVVTFFEKESEVKANRKNIQIEKDKEKDKEKEGLPFGLDLEETDDITILAGLLEEGKREGEKKKLNAIIRADTMGSLEAVTKEIEKLNDEEVEVHILSKSTGEITEKDIDTAKIAKGIVLAFRVPMSKDVELYAKKEHVLVRNYEVIYEMVDEIDVAMTGLIEPEEEEVEVARAKVKQVFTLSNGMLVAGCQVIKGKIIKGYKVFVERKGERLGDGKITSLKVRKEEVKEVEKGQECGIVVEPQVAIEPEDEVVAYKIEKA